MNASQAYVALLKRSLDLFPYQAFDALMEEMARCLKEERNIFIMGNGGSSATASHFVCDMNKGCSDQHTSRFRMICLNDNVPTMMAYANDMAYDKIFVEPLKNFLKKGDLVIGISGSGNSRNVVEALAYAKQHGASTAGLTGFNGGKVAGIVDISVHVPVNDMQIVEDMHTMVMHMTMKHFSLADTHPKAGRAVRTGDD